jgi:Fe-S-cluster formation regulator IscX/YfhJ
LAHSTLDPSRVTFTAILDLAHSILDPSRVTFTAILDLIQFIVDSAPQQSEEKCPIGSLGAYPSPPGINQPRLYIIFSVPAANPAFIPGAIEDYPEGDEKRDVRFYWQVRFMLLESIKLLRRIPLIKSHINPFLSV